MATNPKAAEGICAREGCENPRQGAHCYCSDHRTEVQARYQQDRDNMMRDEGFKLGAEAMKAALLESLRPINPGGMWVVHEVKAWISRTPAPARS